MEPIFDGCRLCLDPSTEYFTTIDNAQLKDQMKKVFYFSIEPKNGYYSSVCQSCSYTISEFYQYSEKVRQNQEALEGNVTNCDPTVDLKIKTNDSGLTGMTENSCEPKEEVSKLEQLSTKDSKITFERVKVETRSDSEFPETTEPNDEMENEDDPCSGEDELYEPPPSEPRKRRLDKNKLDDVEGHDPSKNSQQTITEIQQKRNEENQLFNKHFRMICDLCGKSAATFTALHSHFRKEHKRTGWVVCCNTKLLLRSAMLDHIDFHANPDAFRCEVCGKKFTVKFALSRHKVRKHSRVDQRPFKCDICPQSFALKSDFTNHTIGHVKIQCPECKKFFINKRSYNVHMRTQHGDMDQSIVCTICEELFVTKKYFDRHMKEHMGIEVQRVQCGICQRSLKDRAVLREHMKMVHADGELKFQCNICLKKYRHNRALRSHIRHIHGEPMHECEFCGKKFNNAFSLKEHRTIHTGEILYACEYCGKRMKHKITLRRHIKRDHPAEWAQKRKTVRISEQF